MFVDKNENQVSKEVNEEHDWLYRANERHVKRIHQAIYELTSTAGTKGKQTNPIYTKMLSSLKFVIDNYHTPVEFIFTDLYTKYSEPGVLDKEISLLFNAMKYDNENANNEYNTDEVLYMLENTITFVDRSINSSIKNSFLGAINSKISSTPNVKYILECYKSIDKSIYGCMNEINSTTMSNKGNMSDENHIDELERLIHIIENCLRIQYKVTV